jgi:uncharacterized membrane protein
MDTYSIIFLTLFAAIIASLSQIAFKKALPKNANIMQIIKQVLNKSIIVGGMGYIGSLVIYLYALANAPLSIVYPIFASTFIFIVIFSKFFLNEDMDIHRYIGIALIFIGIIIISITI